jgi:hypothetical protein
VLNIAHEIECSKGEQSVKKISLWIFLVMSRSLAMVIPVSAGNPEKIGTGCALSAREALQSSVGLNINLCEN